MSPFPLPAFRLRAWAPELVAAAIPLAWLLATTGAAVVGPLSLEWLGRGDSASHLIGWLYFARENWHWPPARIESWLVPSGTTIGFADAIPLVAFPLKLLAGALEGPYQYFGLWFAVCLLLQGVLGARILAELGSGERARALGGALLAFSPVVWDRFHRGHFSLAAQWLILAAFLAWVRFFRSGGRPRYLVGLAALPVLAAAIHPYLALINGALLAAILAPALRFGRRRALAALGLLLASAIVSLGVASLGGFLGSGEQLRAGRWGSYAADLAAPLNPGTASRYLSPLFASSGTSEGHAYLGLGLLLLAVAALAVRIGARRREVAAAGEKPDRDHRGLRALWIACALLALVSALPEVHIFGAEIATAKGLTGVLELPLGAFRANGRLMWPLHALLALSVLRWLRPLERKPVASTAVLGLALAIQIAEPATYLSRYGRELVPRDEVEQWRQGTRGLHAAGMLPLFLVDGGNVFCGEIHGDRWVVPAFLAAEAGMTFDSGYVARLEVESARARCSDGQDRLAEARLEPGKVYFVRPRRARNLSRRGLDCARLSAELWTCRRDGGSGGAARRELRRNPAQGTAADQ